MCFSLWLGVEYFVHKEHIFSTGMKLIQFVSTLFFVFCWSTPLGRVSRDFVIGRCLVFKASKSS